MDDKLNTQIEEMEKEYYKTATPAMLWEPVYKDYISRFSHSYLTGNDIYIGKSLLSPDINVFKLSKTISFLKKYFSEHPLAPK